MLNCISNLTNSNKPKDLWSFLESVYNSKLPIKGCDLKIKNDVGEEVMNELINRKLFNTYLGVFFNVFDLNYSYLFANLQFNFSYQVFLEM